MNKIESWDVAIAGGGPAGAAAAYYLARNGLRAVVFEKTPFPRFHIGESLLPLSVPILQEMGIDAHNAPWALRKGGAIVRAVDHDLVHRISFEHTLPGCQTYAFQVERAGFDQALVDRAIAVGAEFRFGRTLRYVEEDDAGVSIEVDGDKLRARYLVMATGRDRLLRGRRGELSLLRGLGKSATFTHFGEVGSAVARTTFARGDILLILTPQTNWCWAIPLPGERLSIGLVHCDGQEPPNPATSLRDFIDQSPLLTGLLEGSRQIEPVHRCANFSYYHRRPFSPRVVAIGDAHGFLDPVFSSGVSLALYMAKAAAVALVEAFHQNRPLPGEELHRNFKHGYTVLERVIERFYRPGWAYNAFFSDLKPDDQVRQLNTILAGDLWREDNEFQNLLLASKRRTVYEQKPAPPSRAEDRIHVAM